MTLADLKAEALVHVDQLRRERDEARACLAFERVTVAELRAEVERLRASVENLDALYISRTDTLRECEAALRTVAERQREACADVVRELLDDEECDCPPEWPRCGLHRAALRLRATPLVTEGDE